MSRQRLGQHFLSSPSILERIAVAACAPGEPLVIEIGPGKGALTERLRARARRVVAIEVDPALVAGLHQRFAGEPRLEIVEADALGADLEQWGRAVLCGNLPYYAATAIMGRAVKAGPTVRESVFLIQKEVAQRVTAAPGSRDYGYLTVELALFARSELLFDVRPGAFRPPPKVMSSVIRSYYDGKAAKLGIADPETFLRFVGECFRRKRKTIRNNLSGIYGKGVDAWPESSLRAEQLTLEQFAALFRRLNTPR